MILYNKAFYSFQNVILVLFISMTVACREKKAEPANNPYAKADIDVIVFRNDSTADSAIGGFGYNINLFNGPYVHQPNIPAINGNRGFKSAEDAEKTGNLTKYKIRNNIMPPTISISELDSLGVLK